MFNLIKLWYNCLIMSIINKSNIKDIALSYNVIPIIKEITGDMETPISIFSVFSDEPFSFFF
jgi:hypothetical protein